MKTGAKQPQHRPGTRTVPTGPFDLFLAMHGLKGRQLRIKAHGDSALGLAKWLEPLPAVERLGCPGPQDHPRHALCAGRVARWHRKPDRSARQHAAIMTHASVPAANRKRLDISDGLVRQSAGVEDPTGLKAELVVALS